MILNYLVYCFEVFNIVYMQHIVIIFMTERSKRLEKIRERLSKLSEEEKSELARLAGEAYGKRRTRQSS